MYFRSFSFWPLMFYPTGHTHTRTRWWFHGPWTRSIVIRSRRHYSSFNIIYLFGITAFRSVARENRTIKFVNVKRTYGTCRQAYASRAVQLDASRTTRPCNKRTMSVLVRWKVESLSERLISPQQKIYDTPLSVVVVVEKVDFLFVSCLNNLCQDLNFFLSFLFCFYS